MPMIIMGVLACIGAATGGVAAAQEFCSQEAQAQKVLAQTQQFVQSSDALFKNLQALDTQLQSQIANVQMQESTAVNTLSDMKQQFASTMQKAHIGVAIVILIVFMLLLGKKLKIYNTSDLFQHRL
jgi:predicted PurR-regulated permease PerM